MKTLLIVLIGGLPLVASADYIRCHSQSVCLKRATACSQSSRDNKYVQESGTVTAYAHHVLELEEKKICFGKRKEPIEFSQSQASIVWRTGYASVKELRSPETLNDVPEAIIKEAEGAAMENCEASRQLTLETYENCK